MTDHRTRDYEQRLAELGITMPAAPKPRGAYVLAVRVGELVFSSGQGPSQDGTWAYQGRVGGELTLDEGRRAARISVLNCLAAIRSVVGSLNAIQRIVALRGFVSSAPGFADQTAVIDGASDLLLEVFGGTGAHARSAVGTSQLPFNIPVEVELIVQVVGD